MPDRVLHIITRYLRGGGTEKNTIYSIRALEKTKFSVDIAMGRESDLSYAEKELPGINEIIVIKALDNDFNPIKNLKALFEIFRLIRKNGYKIVHTHQCKASILGCLAAKFASTPVVILGLHGDYLENPRFKGLLRKTYELVERIAVHHASMIISVGEEVKERYVKRYGLSPSRCQVVRSGMELSNFFHAATLSEDKISQKKGELDIRRDELVVGKVSSLEFRKGYRFAIEAAAKIIRANSEGIKFLFVGEGAERAELEGLAERLGINERIVFTGFREDVDELMAIFDVFIFTSLMEGLPQVLVQAAAAGRPVVSFEVEGVREIIKDGVSGFIVPSGDVDALAEKVNFLLSHPDKAKVIGRQGRESIGNKWDVKVMQERIRAIYDKLSEVHLTHSSN